MFNEYQKIHFIGIGGIGVSAVARLCFSLGKEVSGSDAAESINTRELKKLGVNIFIGHSESNLSEDVNLVVYSPAVQSDNLELKKARSQNILCKSYPEILGKIMEEFSDSIAVSGTNGKTTTTALTGLILEKAGFDPTVIVGGKVLEWGGNLRIGKNKKYFIAEACEYKRAIDNLRPKNIVLTNIEEDHLDYFKDLEDIKSAFRDYVSKMPESGILAYNADDAVSAEIALTAPVKKIGYSVKSAEAGLFAANIIKENGKQIFDLIYKGKNLGKFEIHIPGIFNIYNCLAASLISLELGVSPEIIKEVLYNFKGTWRRFERMGEINGSVIVSDYAHHPTAVKQMIAGAKEFYPGKKILAVFEPHQKDRTIKLFDDFAGSFSEADEAIISEIFSVEGRNDAERDISSLDLVEAIRKKYPSFKISYSKNPEEAKKMILEKISGFGVILIMGAGNIYKTAEELTFK